MIQLMLLLAVTAAPTETPKEGKLFQALGYAMFAAKAGDLVSTHYGLQNGGTELNPMMQSQGARIAASVAAPALIYLGTSHLHKQGHEKLALWMRIGTVVGWSLATANNMGAFR